MLIGDPPQIISEQMSALVEVAPRADVRLSTNLETALGNTGRELFCQTENISRTGMLVRTKHRPQLGSTVVFKIHVGDGGPPIIGRGELVRHTSPAFGQHDGVGIRFISFAGDGVERLDTFLEQEFRGGVTGSLIFEQKRD